MNNTNRADRSPEEWESDLPISDDQQTEALVFMSYIPNLSTVTGDSKIL